MDMNIKLFRLQNGEDVISDFEYIHPENDMPSHYKFKNPLKVVYFTQGLMNGDKFMVSLLPWIFTSLTDTKEFIVLPRDILTTADPSIKLAKYYVEVSAKISEMFEEIPLANEKTPRSFGRSVEEELDMMDDNEEQLANDDYAEMLRKALAKKPKNNKKLH